MAQRILPGVILSLTLAGTPSFTLATQAEDLGIVCKRAISTPEATLCVNDAYGTVPRRLPNLSSQMDQSLRS